MRGAWLCALRRAGMSEQVMYGGDEVARRAAETAVLGTPRVVKQERTEAMGSGMDESSLAPTDTQALQTSLLASLKVSMQQMLDAQLPQALTAGCAKALGPFVRDINALKAQQNALHYSVVQLEISAARNHAELMTAIAAKATAGMPAAAASAGGATAAPAASTAQAAPSSQGQDKGGRHEASQKGRPLEAGPDEEIIALVFFPKDVGHVMLTAHDQQVLAIYSTEEARARTRPRIGQLSNTFGIRFASRAHVEYCVENFEEKGYEVRNLASGDFFALDTKIASPKQADKSRGLCIGSSVRPRSRSLTSCWRSRSGLCSGWRGRRSGWPRSISTLRCRPEAGPHSCRRFGVVLTHLRHN